MSVRRPAQTAEQAESLGAKFLKLKTAIDATGAGGYARELTAEERASQQAELNEAIASQDVVITTAQIPGRKPPVLVTADAVRAMRSGSVIVDMAASALGGNCELSQAGETVVTENGVTIVAPENLPATMPSSSSQFYARNISALLLTWSRTGTSPSTSRRRSPRRPSSRMAARSCPRRSEAAGTGRRQRMSPEVTVFLSNLTIFVLAIMCGFAVISKVPATLHTPLMSGANSIHGIVLVGAMFIAVAADSPISYLLSFVAVAFATLNVVGGYVVTDRMLQMFKRKPAAPKAEKAEG